MGGAPVLLHMGIPTKPSRDEGDPSGLPPLEGTEQQFRSTKWHQGNGDSELTLVYRREAHEDLNSEFIDNEPLFEP